MPSIAQIHAYLLNFRKKSFRGTEIKNGFEKSKHLETCY